MQNGPIPPKCCKTNDSRYRHCRVSFRNGFMIYSLPMFTQWSQVVNQYIVPHIKFDVCGGSRYTGTKPNYAEFTEYATVRYIPVQKCWIYCKFSKFSITWFCTGIFRTVAYFEVYMRNTLLIYNLTSQREHDLQFDLQFDFTAWT